MANLYATSFALGIDPAARLFSSPFQAPSRDHPSPMRWLIRYVEHCKVLLNPSGPIDRAIGSHFSKPAWRLACRSRRDAFLPILRNRLLTFHDLIRYAEALVQSGWQHAPEPWLLAAMLSQRYEYFDSTPSVPTERRNMVMLRLATKQKTLSRKDFLLVGRWMVQSNANLRGQEQWQGLMKKAKAWADRRRAEHQTAQDPTWHFFCDKTAWRGYEIIPLTDGMELWEEGETMAHCVFDIRHACNLSAPSRFFSVRRKGKRYATIELEYERGNESLVGIDRLFGKWSLRDCRLSANRLMPEDQVRNFKVFAWQYNLWSQRPSRQPIKA